jgi:NAD(P)-dependent dehydrogenase (short-subunit alcohol dehydrogenase family)
VIHVWKVTAIEWARHITVNAVAPGWVRTELLAHLIEDQNMLQRYLKSIPLRRLGEPEEIGPLVAFLSSDLASIMTGSVVVADGGWRVDDSLILPVHHWLPMSQGSLQRDSDLSRPLAKGFVKRSG